MLLIPDSGTWRQTTKML